MESTVDSQRNRNSNAGEEEKEDWSKTFEVIISTLPKGEGWLVFNNLFKYQGFWFPDIALNVVLSAQKHFRAPPSNIFLCNAPKTGTTWLKALAFAIVSRTSFNDSSNPLLSKLPHHCVRSFEFPDDVTSCNQNAGNTLFATHIPYSCLPKSIIDSGCKIVYMCRDPKDTFVSTYHFFAKMLTSKNMEPLPLDKAFELFCKGESFYGPYWDHVLGYWRASVDWPDRILFLKYEDVREDTAFYAKKLAEFVGHPFSLEEEEKGVVNKIVGMCSFEYLSNLDVNKNGKLRMGDPIWDMQSNSIFFRKGKVGDWENYLTPEMAARDSITEQKLSDSGLDLIHRRKL